MPPSGAGSEEVVVFVRIVNAFGGSRDTPPSRKGRTTTLVTKRRGVGMGIAGFVWLRVVVIIRQRKDEQLDGIHLGTGFVW